MDPYLLAKWVHILSSTVLFGTGIGTAFQMVWAMRTGQVETIASVSAGVVVADWLFTAPAGIVQPLSGLRLVHLTGASLTEPWLISTYGLYLLAFAFWLPVVGLQIGIRNAARRALVTEQPLPESVHRAFRVWFILGWPAFGALTMIFWLMITKPALWG